MFTEKEFMATEGKELPWRAEKCFPEEEKKEGAGLVLERTLYQRTERF